MKIAIIGEMHSDGWIILEKSNFEVFEITNFNKDNLKKELADVDGIILRTAANLTSDILKDSFLMPSSLFYLAMMIGLLSLAARRLQDRGHSGWWQLANIIPGILFLIPYFAILDSIITGGSFVPGQAIAATIFGIISFGTGVTMIVFLCLPPKEDENKWGRNPLLSDNRFTDQIPD